MVSQPAAAAGARNHRSTLVLWEQNGQPEGSMPRSHLETWSCAQRGKAGVQSPTAWPLGLLSLHTEPTLPDEALPPPS